MKVLQILLYATTAIVGTIITAAVIWRDPGTVELLDMTNGPGGPALNVYDNQNDLNLVLRRLWNAFFKIFDLRAAFSGKIAGSRARFC